MVRKSDHCDLNGSLGAQSQLCADEPALLKKSPDW